MKLSDLIKQLKREYKSGGEVEVAALSITPDGKVIIGGSFESGPVRASVFDGTLESKHLEKSVAIFDEREPAPEPFQYGTEKAARKATKIKE